jgi:hypothetical protein
VRPMYVPVRLAAAVMAVSAAAGCMSVGDGEGGPATPSHSAGQRGGEAPDGGPAGVGGGYLGPRGGDGKHGDHKGKDEASGSPSASASPSAQASESAPAKPVKRPHRQARGADPAEGAAADAQPLARPGAARAVAGAAVALARAVDRGAVVVRP